MGKYKVEIMNLPHDRAFWFDTREEVDTWVDFLTSCPVDDGPIKLRITEYAAAKVEYVEGRLAQTQTDEDHEKEST